MPKPAPHVPVLFGVDAKQVDRTVGLIAFALPFLTFLLARLDDQTCFMMSISHFYYTRIGGDLLVGMLSVIGVILLMFYTCPKDPETGKCLHDAAGKNLARHPRNVALAKFAGVCALLVAFVPTGKLGCEYEPDDAMVSRYFLTETGIAAPAPGETGPAAAGMQEPGGTPTGDFWLSFPRWDTPSEVPLPLYHTHYIAAAGMIGVLAYFSIFVFTQVQTPCATVDRSLNLESKTRVKRRRNIAYVWFGIGMAVSGGALAGRMLILTFWPDLFDGWFDSGWNAHALTFWFEAGALASFGASWMLKGRFLGIGEDDCPPAAPSQPVSARRAT